MAVSGLLHALAASPTGKEPPYPLDRRLGRPRASLDTGEERNLFPCQELNLSPIPRLYTDIYPNSVLQKIIICGKVFGGALN
jgi:hypothetical protein